MTLNLSNLISKGRVLEGSRFLGIKYGKDRLEVKVNGEIVKIAIKVLPKETMRQDIRFGLFRWSWHWTHTKIGDGRAILIDRYSAYNRFRKLEIDRKEIDKGIVGVSDWTLFSDSNFKINGILTFELDEIKKYVLNNYSNWDKPRHISPKESGLRRAIEFVDGKAYLLLNSKKNKDWKSSGATKVVCDAICLNDGTTDVSASFSFLREGPDNTKQKLPNFKAKIQKELKIMNEFKEDDRFIQSKHFIEYVDKKRYYKARMIMPKCKDDVYNVLKCSKKYGITENDRLDIARQMAAIIDTVHEKGWILRDIKSENFLLKNENGKWKVLCSDLEMFCKITDKVACQNFCGTPLFFSPEYIYQAFSERNSPIGTMQQDMWALGHALGEILGVYTNERNALRCNTLEGLYTKIVNLPKNWLPLRKTPKEWLVFNLLNVDPAKRFSSKDTLKYMNEKLNPPTVVVRR